MLRESSVFEFKNGDHTCVFYRSANQLMQILNPYIADGLRRGDRCFCVQKPGILKRLVYDLRFLGIDPDEEMRRGALELRSEEDTYLPNGHFEPEAMMEMLIRSIAEAREQGFQAFRSAGELSWAVEGRNECDRVIGYEQLVDEYYPGQPAIGLCQYSIHHFSPDVLRAVVRKHRMQLCETASGSHCSSLYVRNRDWTAELVAEKSFPRRYYFVVENRPSRDVLGWGVAADFQGASEGVDQLTRQPAATGRMASGGMV